MRALRLLSLRLGIALMLCAVIVMARTAPAVADAQADITADTRADLDDADARAQYAFFTADARGLEEIVQMIERLEVPESLAPLREYNAAYGRWKLAELYGEAADREGTRPVRTLAIKAAQACLAHTKAALLADAELVEAYVVDAACTALTQPSRPEMRSSIPTCARSKSFRTALELAPHNPRVMLMEAQCLRVDEAQAHGALAERLRAVVAAFEAAPPARPGYPDWGQAEALLLLGRNYLQHGDTRAARDVIEKALVIAPDYRRARELLDTATVRPH